MSLRPAVAVIAVSIHSFNQLHLVGQGAFGKVRVVEHKQTKERYALKCISKGKCKERSGYLNVLREHDILELLVDHPYVPSLRYAFQDPTTLYLVLDLKPGGDLRHHLKKQHPLGFAEAAVKLWVAEISCALHYLHTAHGIIHRDVKPENIFMDAQGHVCLGDFNAATWIKSGEERKLHGVTGTTSYMAPELLLRQGYSFSVDWWSLGVVMYECIYGRRPFRKQDHGGSRERLKTAILRENIVIPDDRSVSVDCIAVIRGLLCSDPEKRLGCGVDGHERLRRHPFFADIDWKRAEKKALRPVFVPGDCLINGLSDQSQGAVFLGDDHSDDSVGLAAAGVGSADSQAELRALERGFTRYSYAEFAKYRDYVAQHGKITAADRLDVYLAQMYLDGRPLVTVEGEDSMENAEIDRDADDDDDEAAAADDADRAAQLARRKSHFYASVAAGAIGLAHRARALGGSQGGQGDQGDQGDAVAAAAAAAARVKRRTTTSEAPCKSGKRRLLLRRSWRSLKTRGQQQQQEEEGAEEALAEGLDGAFFSDNDAYSQKHSVPPSNVPIDMVIWAQMRPGQRRLAHRFSSKMDIDAEYAARVLLLADRPCDAAATSVSRGRGTCGPRGTRGMRALTGNLPAAHTLSSPSSSPSLQSKHRMQQHQAPLSMYFQQQQQQAVRQKPSFLYSVRHQPSASTLMDYGAVAMAMAAGSGCSSPTTLQTSFPLSPTAAAVPRLQPIASGWTKQPAAAKCKKEPTNSSAGGGADEARDTSIHQRLESQLVL